MKQKLKKSDLIDLLDYTAKDFTSLRNQMEEAKHNEDKFEQLRRQSICAWWIHMCVRDVLDNGSNDFEITQ